MGAYDSRGHRAETVSQGKDQKGTEVQNNSSQSVRVIKNNYYNITFG